MLHLLATAATAAVLCGGEIALVQAEPPEIVRRLPLPGTGATLFAAPDGRMVVPLAGADATVVVGGDGPPERWEGRLFPLFFDEVDRMVVVFPGTLATLSYPERVVLERVPLTGVEGAWRAACSRDGRLAAVVPAHDRTSLVLSGTRRDGADARAALAAPAQVVAVAPDAGFAVAGLVDGTLQLVVPGGPSWIGTAGGRGRVTALAIADDGRELIAGTAADGAGAVAGHTVDEGKEAPLRLRRVSELDAPVIGLALASDGTLFVLTPEGVTVLARRGRRQVGTVSLAGGTELVALPAAPRSLAPKWDER